MVRLSQVTKVFSDTHTVALENIDFYMKPGEICYLKGESGCGKTTLLRLLLGELKADCGQVYVNGKNVAELDKRQLPVFRRNIGFVFQDYKLIDDVNVFQNVALARYVTGTSNRNLTIQVAHALRMVGLEEKFKSFPDELSGGEQQKVAIARALVGNPMLILADEPTGNLDPVNSKMIMDLLHEIHEKMSMTMLIATHDEEAIEHLCAKEFVLENKSRMQV